MKQLSFKHHWKLFVDGASRNNPGPSGAGIYILKDAEVFEKKGYYLGTKTNNQAEYLALVLGLLLLKKSVQPEDRVHIISDSQLLVRQLKGEYKIKSPGLKQLYGVALSLTSELKAELFHVLRIENQEADAMANYGIDKKKIVPPTLLAALKNYEIIL